MCRNCLLGSVVQFLFLALNDFSSVDCGFCQDSCETNGEDPEFKVSVPSPELFSANALLTATMLVALIAGQEGHPTSMRGARVLPDS